MEAPERNIVLGLDNIRLDLPIAGVGSRVLAAFVDTLIVLVGVALWGVALLFLLPETLGDWRIALFVVGYFVIDQGYFATSEIATRGRTLGKSAVGLRVVARDGGTAGVSAYLLRNLVREIDVLIGVFLMALDPMSRRLGDRLGNTLVVHEDSGRRDVTLGRIPPGWSAREVALAESYFARTGELDPDQALFLARRFNGWLARDAPELLRGADPDHEPIVALRDALLPVFQDGVAAGGARA